MKTTTWNGIGKKIPLSLFATIMIVSINSCSTKVAFLASSVVPAARGDVKVKKDDNKNYHIQIRLDNLAEVSRLQPPKQSYVVWMESGEEAAKNIGKINSSSGLLSSKLKASFGTVSATKPSKIFITAEDDASAQYPAGQVILTTDNF